jgi:hypothetical protein
MSVFACILTFVRYFTNNEYYYVYRIEEVAWDGDNIVVLNEVRISPPYKVEDVKGDKEASVIHVKKIVDRHWKELSSSSVTT